MTDYSSKVEVLYSQPAYVRLNKEKKNGYIVLTRPILSKAEAQKAQYQVQLTFIEKSNANVSILQKVSEELALDLQKKPTDRSRIISISPSRHSTTLNEVTIRIKKPAYGYYDGSITIGEQQPIFFHDSSLDSKITQARLMGLFEDELDISSGQVLLEVIRLLVNDVVKQSEQVYLVNPLSVIRGLKIDKKEEVKQQQQQQPQQQPITFNDIFSKVATVTGKLIAKLNDSDILRKLDPPPDMDFDSGRVYLAKWANMVKKEAELSNGSQLSSEFVSDLSAEEIARAKRRDPVGKDEWASFFDSQGRLRITISEVKSIVFHGGLEEDVRAEAWPFILGVFDFNATTEERAKLKEKLANAYYTELIRNDFRDEQIEKDVVRTDREIFLTDSKHDELIEDQIARSPELFSISRILHTFTVAEGKSYGQGMSDMLTPIYIAVKDEAVSYYCFKNLMDNMYGNFLEDMVKIREDMVLLSKLLQLMLPELYAHLVKCHSHDMYFIFRSLIVHFKRELTWEQVPRFWEVSWCHPSNNFVIFFALAILQDNERIVIQNLRAFDEVLKYFNDLLGKLDLDVLLVRAELLYLKLKRTINIIDRSLNRGEEVNVSEDMRTLLRST